MVGSIKENYPDLQSNKNVGTLMAQLEGTENRINVARTRYNNAVNSYNNSVVTFPTSIVASMTNHHTYNYYKANSNAQSAPKVKF